MPSLHWQTQRASWEQRRLSRQLASRHWWTAQEKKSAVSRQKSSHVTRDTFFFFWSDQQMSAKTSKEAAELLYLHRITVKCVVIVLYLWTSGLMSLNASTRPVFTARVIINSNKKNRSGLYRRLVLVKMTNILNNCCQAQILKSYQLLKSGTQEEIAVSSI